MSLTLAPSRKINQLPVAATEGETPTWEIAVPVSGYLQVSLQMVCVGSDGLSPRPVVVRLERSPTSAVNGRSYFAGSIDARIEEGFVSAGDVVNVVAAPVYVSDGYCWVDEVAAVVSDVSLGDVVANTDFGPVWAATPVGNGATAVGAVAVVANTVAVGTPTPMVTYQWQCDMVDIVGETSASLTIPASAAEKLLECVVTATGATTIVERVTFGTAGKAPTAPGAPESFTATRVNAGEFDAAQLDWDRPIDAGFPAADRLEINYRLVGATTWISQADATDPTGSGTRFGHSYSDGDTFEYRVRFINDTAPGDWSSIGSVTYPDGTTTGGFFTTADGGFFTTSDGGFFTVDDS